jgi:Thioredoxin like C-terminal domain
VQADRPAEYNFPQALEEDEFAYDGTWTVESERIVSGKDARLKLHFHAQKVYLVLGGHGDVRVTVNGRLRGRVRVDGDRLYTLVSQKRDGEGVLELAFTPQLSAYAFTFG